MSIVWRKSSHSSGVNDEACVELAESRATVAVRDSKNPRLGHFTLSGRQFAGLVGGVKRG
ncbi:DUF397 domain-containing protein [Actinocorallia longicatena]|uniref:DUF397 domain-containing protein n=1 Tax=Actinocorallia longicatena TaxID=111803 RepID=A0ABP6QEQ2_9ACTN